MARSDRPADNVGGGGIVIRDYYGSFSAGACHFSSHIADAECAELLACKRGLQVASEIQGSSFGDRQYMGGSEAFDGEFGPILSWSLIWLRK
jgi:hypothetical protein